MYQIGELIVYGNTGVCRVADITDCPGAGADKGRRYYVLEPLYQTCVIKVPVDGTKVFTRPVISRGEALRLIDRIPTLKAEACHSRGLRELSQHYEAFLQKHDCGELIRLTMSIYAKKRLAEGENRRLGAVDERFMRRAEALLFGELAAVLEIPLDTVQDFIADRVREERPPRPGPSA